MKERMTWAARQGNLSPLGATWIPKEGAHNSALYSKYAEKVTVHLYQADDLVPSSIQPLLITSKDSGTKLAVFGIPKFP